MNLDQIHNVYLIGIGGIGMNAFRLNFRTLGKSGSGYDKASTEMTIFQQ